MTSLKKEIAKTQQELWDALVRRALSKNEIKLKERHIDDYAAMMRKHELFSSEHPFEFPNKEVERAFMIDFAELGHTHVYSRLCRCRNNDVVGG